MTDSERGMGEEWFEETSLQGKETSPDMSNATSSARFFWFDHYGWWFGGSPDDRYAPRRGPYKTFGALLADCASFFPQS